MSGMCGDLIKLSIHRKATVMINFVNIQDVIRKVWPPGCAPKRLQELLGVSFSTARKYCYQEVAIGVRRELLGKLIIVIDEKIAALRILRKQITDELGECDGEFFAESNVDGDLRPRDISVITRDLGITIGRLDPQAARLAKYISEEVHRWNELQQAKP
jgi:ABC-type Zn2+ transport system substrate-binding protein/surface adhesin